MKAELLFPGKKLLNIVRARQGFKRCDLGLVPVLNPGALWAGRSLLCNTACAREFVLREVLCSSVGTVEMGERNTP